MVIERALHFILYSTYVIFQKLTISFQLLAISFNFRVFWFFQTVLSFLNNNSQKKHYQIFFSCDLKVHCQVWDFNDRRVFYYAFFKKVASFLVFRLFTRFF